MSVTLIKDHIASKSSFFTLPALPEGMFWRVREGAFHTDVVELRKKVWFFSVKKASLMRFFYNVKKNDDGRRSGIYDPKDNIRKAAEYLYRLEIEKQNPVTLRVEAIKVIPRDPKIALDDLERKYTEEYKELRKDYVNA